VSSLLEMVAAELAKCDVRLEYVVTRCGTEVASFFDFDAARDFADDLIGWQESRVPWERVARDGFRGLVYGEFSITCREIEPAPCRFCRGDERAYACDCV
jgi:hypothetical protein